ncbi:hypothetical protein WMY93_022239 [Mugilogobius chulae]|uniref:C3H1-type domain-containing protein n=1 Tax=Mugilogobius chulae TaxID=88201 RepID=A0AAW0NHL6_9GOBI
MGLKECCDLQRKRFSVGQTLSGSSLIINSVCLSSFQTFRWFRLGFWFLVSACVSSLQSIVTVSLMSLFLKTYPRLARSPNVPSQDSGFKSQSLTWFSYLSSEFRLGWKLQTASGGVQTLDVPTFPVGQTLGSGSSPVITPGSVSKSLSLSSDVPVVRLDVPGGSDSGSGSSSVIDSVCLFPQTSFRLWVLVLVSSLTVFVSLFLRFRGRSRWVRLWVLVLVSVIDSVCLSFLRRSQWTFPVDVPGGSDSGFWSRSQLQSLHQPMSHSVSLVPSDLLPSAPVIVPGSPTVSVNNASSGGQKLLRTDKLEVCREFQRGNCRPGETDCRFAHPSDSPMIDNQRQHGHGLHGLHQSRCSREKCKYFHPPAHLQAKIKAAQHQANQSAVAAQAAAMTHSAAKVLKRPLEAAVDMAFPHGVLQPLPKRPALDKTNGASSLFNPNVLHYQQALANAQLQQPAFFPTGSVLS